MSKSDKDRVPLTEHTAANNQHTAEMGLIDKMLVLEYLEEVLPYTCFRYKTLRETYS